MQQDWCRARVPRSLRFLQGAGAVNRHSFRGTYAELTKVPSVLVSSPGMSHRAITTPWEKIAPGQKHGIV
jgi:hypothetical protein